MGNPNYKPVSKGGLGAELINYFLISNAKPDAGTYVPRTITDFLDDCEFLHHGEYPNLGLEIRLFIQRLINEALLYSVGFDPAQSLPFNERLISYAFSEKAAEYGSYEFAMLGFLEVRNRFEGSVIPIVVRQEVAKVVIGEVAKEVQKSVSLSWRIRTLVNRIRQYLAKENDQVVANEENEYEEKENIGTAFIVGKSRLVTALHCLPKGAIIDIPNWNSHEAHLLSIRTFGVEAEVPPFKIAGTIDLAVLQFDREPFPAAKALDLWTGEVLEPVLCLGFPMLKGFDNVLVTATGEIVGNEKSLITTQRYLVFDARVKGGNSGGPLLNRLGKVVGVVTEMLADSSTEPDILGYGLATPAPALFDLLKACDEEDPTLYNVRFNQIGGLRIL